MHTRDFREIRALLDVLTDPSRLLTLVDLVGLVEAHDDLTQTHLCGIGIVADVQAVTLFDLGLRDRNLAFHFHPAYFLQQQPVFEALAQIRHRAALKVDLTLELFIGLDVHLLHDVLLPLLEKARRNPEATVFRDLQYQHVVDDAFQNLFLQLGDAGFVLFRRRRRPELLHGRLDFLIELGKGDDLAVHFRHDALHCLGECSGREYERGG